MSDPMHDAIVALQQARAEVKRLQKALTDETRVATDLQRQRDEALARLASIGMKAFDVEWRDILRTMAERQREACAVQLNDLLTRKKATALSQIQQIAKQYQSPVVVASWVEADQIRATPLVTDDIEQMQRIWQEITRQT